MALVHFPFQPRTPSLASNYLHLVKYHISVTFSNYHTFVTFWVIFVTFWVILLSHFSNICNCQQLSGQNLSLPDWPTFVPFVKFVPIFGATAFQPTPPLTLTFHEAPLSFFSLWPNLKIDNLMFCLIELKSRLTIFTFTSVATLSGNYWITILSLKGNIQEVEKPTKAKNLSWM